MKEIQEKRESKWKNRKSKPCNCKKTKRKDKIMSNILILEDDPQRIQIFHKYLVIKYENEHDVYIVDNVKDAVRYLKNDNAIFNYILLDHDLGGQIYVPSEDPNTGYQVAKYIAENKIDENAEIIIHTCNIPASGKMKALLPKAHLIPFNQLYELFISDNIHFK